MLAPLVASLQQSSRLNHAWLYEASPWMQVVLVAAFLSPQERPRWHDSRLHRDLEDAVSVKCRSTKTRTCACRLTHCHRVRSISKKQHLIGRSQRI